MLVTLYFGCARMPRGGQGVQLGAGLTLWPFFFFDVGATCCVALFLPGVSSQKKKARKKTADRRRDKGRVFVTHKNFVKTLWCNVQRYTLIKVPRLNLSMILKVS